MKKSLLFFMVMLLVQVATAQNNVLVVDYNNAFSSDQSTTWNKSEVYNRLVATNTSVTRINSIPATINTAYDECWIFGNMGTTTATNLNPVINYINAGGAVYIQSEVSCCNNQAAFVDNLINSVTIVGGSITHVVTKSSWFEFEAHTDIICGPWPRSYGAACRPFVGTPSNNILFAAMSTCGNAIGTGDVVGVRFGACDMIGGRGALVANGDFNIFPSGGTCTSTGILGTPNNPNVIDLIADLMDSLLICKTTGCPVLPVQLLDFEGENRSGENRLFWTTLSEINNDYFTVERSTDALEFEAIGQLKGAGNSATQLDYEFIDKNPPSGIVYYRLRQTDFDQAYSFSKMITLTNTKEINLTLYPNPVEDIIVVTSNNSINTVSVYSIVGKQLLSLQPDNGFNFKLNLNQLSAGTYFISVVGKDGLIKTQKFMKN